MLDSNLPDHKLDRILDNAVKYDTFVTPQQKRRAWLRLAHQIRTIEPARQRRYVPVAARHEQRESLWHGAVLFWHFVMRLYGFLIADEQIYQRAHQHRIRMDYHNFMVGTLG